MVISVSLLCHCAQKVELSSTLKCTPSLNVQYWVPIVMVPCRERRGVTLMQMFNIVY